MNFILVCCLLAFWFVWPHRAPAQQSSILAGTVTDARTRAPIPYASLSIAHTPIGTVSNSEGSFRLQLAGHLTDTVVVQALGYSTRKVRVTPALLSSSQPLTLQPQAVALHVVSVTGLSPTTLIKKAVRRSWADMASPVVLNTYFREFVTKDSAYIKFGDALIDYYIEQNRRRPAHPRVQARVVESRVSEAPAEAAGLMAGCFPPPHDVVSSGEYYNVTNGSPFLDSASFRFYTYQLDMTTASADGTEAAQYVLTCTPRTHAENHLRRATVRIDQRTLHIRSIESEVPLDLQQYQYQAGNPFVTARLTTFRKRVVYHENNGRLYPAFVWTEGGWRVAQVTKPVTYYVFTSELLVTNLANNPAPFPDSEQYSGPLYKRGTHYEHPYWLENNSVPATEAEAKAISELASK